MLYGRLHRTLKEAADMESITGEDLAGVHDQAYSVCSLTIEIERSIWAP